MKSIKLMLATVSLLLLCGCGTQVQKENEATCANESKENAVIENMMSRRSIRKYKPQAVNRDTMQIILNCGINAPNGQNKQSWAIRVVDNPDFINGITEVYKKQNNLQQIEGVDIESDGKNEVEISRIKITNEEGEKALNKPIGNYITLDVKQIKLADEERLEVIAEIVADELRNTISKHVKNTDDIMVVGLGNLYVTPDALGPKVVPEIEVTRHILEYMPKVMPEDTRPVSAISPGVLGITGIETMEILKGVVDNVKPKLLIVIDALASRSIDRISSSIQIADTGIVPGAGVENKRKEISQNTLGIPVIAIGIPTVVDLATVTNECIDIFIESLQEKAMSNDYLNKLKEKDNYEEIKEALVPKDYNMIVTPKEIDKLIENMSKIISRAINMAM